MYMNNPSGLVTGAPYQLPGIWAWDRHPDVTREKGNSIALLLKLLVMCFKFKALLFKGVSATYISGEVLLMGIQNLPFMEE